MGFRNPITSYLVSKLNGQLTGVIQALITNGNVGPTVITGATIQTDVPPNKRVEINSTTVDRISFHTGAAESTPANIHTGTAAGGGLFVEGESGAGYTGTTPRAKFFWADAATSEIDIVANILQLFGSFIVNGIAVASSVRGESTVTTDAGGNFTINHGFPTSAVSVSIVTNRATVTYFQLTSRAANSLTMRAYDGAGAIIANTAISIYWTVTA
jgi:hypothetical protein